MVEAPRSRSPAAFSATADMRPACRPRGCPRRSGPRPWSWRRGPRRDVLEGDHRAALILEAAELDRLLAVYRTVGWAKSRSASAAARAGRPDIAVMTEMGDDHDRPRAIGGRRGHDAQRAPRHRPTPPRGDVRRRRRSASRTATMRRPADIRRRPARGWSGGRAGHAASGRGHAAAVATTAAPARMTGAPTTAAAHRTGPHWTTMGHDAALPNDQLDHRRQRHRPRRRSPRTSPTCAWGWPSADRPSMPPGPRRRRLMDAILAAIDGAGVARRDVRTATPVRPAALRLSRRASRRR